jgi:hypothetical protein
MQPMPHPDSWFIEWLGQHNLLNREIVAEYQKKRDAALQDHPLLDPNRPTLGGLLERDGLLTKEQREAGEREAGRRQGEFAAWRSQTLASQERRRPPGP